MQDTLPKRLLFLAATAIVAVTMWYTQHLAGISGHCQGHIHIVSLGHGYLR